MKRYKWTLVEIVVFGKVVGHFERKFQENGGRPPTTVGVRKQESLGYHAWPCLSDPTFSCFDTITACDGQTDTRSDRHTTTANTRARHSVARVKSLHRSSVSRRLHVVDESYSASVILFPNVACVYYTGLL